MATYYWVGVNLPWNSASGWSLTSGGAGGAGVPTSADDLILDNNSGSGTWRNGTANLVCRNFTVTANCSMLWFEQFYSGNNTIQLYGDMVVLKNNFFRNGTGGSGTIFIQTYKSGAQSITSSGTNSYYSLTVKSGSVTTLLNGFDFGDIQFGAIRSLTVESGGTLVLACPVYACDVFNCNSGGTVTFGGSGAQIFTCNTSFTVSSTATTNVTNSDYVIKMDRSYTATAGVTFSGGGKTYPKLEYTQTYSVTPSVTYADLTISGVNTFGSITVTVYNVNMRVILNDDISVTGSIVFNYTPFVATYKNYLQTSSAGVSKSITLTGSMPPAQRLVVQDITAVRATPFPAFVSDGCVNNGNNVNWNFGAVGFAILLQ